MRVEKTLFGRTSGGAKIWKVTFHCDNGSSASFINYGATIQSLIVPDSSGELSDVVLGFDTVSRYESQGWRCGAVIGRTCGRIRNAELEIGGTRFRLAVNEGIHHLHGGVEGFDRKIWDIVGIRDDQVTMRYVSSAHEEGYPGELAMTATYGFSEKQELVVRYMATSSADTVCNPTSHVYFNLAGHGHGSIHDHRMKIVSDRFAERDVEALIDGTITSVVNRKEDFRTYKKMGTPEGELEIESACYLLEDENTFHDACEVFEPRSKRRLRVTTSLPALLFYGGKFIRGSLPGKDGAIYGSHGGFCLETLQLPGLYGHGGLCVLHEGDLFQQETRFKFSAPGI